MNKRISMLILLLIGSMLFVSCKKKETNINEKTGELYISYNGEIQQFDIDTESVTGLIKNIESLAWLAPRGGLEMELVGEDISEEENVYISQGINLDNEENDDAIWLKIVDSLNDKDQGTGTSIPEEKDILVYVHQEDMYMAIQNADFKWQIWKLAGYGEWLEKEIGIFIRVVTGI